MRSFRSREYISSICLMVSYGPVRYGKVGSRGRWYTGSGVETLQVCQPPATFSWTRGVGMYQSRVCEDVAKDRVDEGEGEDEDEENEEDERTGEWRRRW